jgi:hypothetical protein
VLFIDRAIILLLMLGYRVGSAQLDGSPYVGLRLGSAMPRSCDPVLYVYGILMAKILERGKWNDETVQWQCFVPN